MLSKYVRGKKEENKVTIDDAHAVIRKGVGIPRNEAVTGLLIMKAMKVKLPKPGNT